MSVLQNRKFEVVRAFKYGGRELSPGDEWVPGDGRWDDQIADNRKMVRPVEEKHFNEVIKTFGQLGVTLSRAGYETLDALREASDEQILNIRGVGKSRLADIREALT